MQAESQLLGYFLLFVKVIAHTDENHPHEGSKSAMILFFAPEPLGLLSLCWSCVEGRLCMAWKPMVNLIVEAKFKS